MRETGTHAGMSQPRDDGELVAIIVEDVEVGRDRIVSAGLRGKEIVGMQSERCADADHATRRLFGVERDLGVISKYVEPRECKGDTCGTDESATADIHGCILVANGYLL